MNDKPSPAIVHVPQERWDRRLQANELRALLAFLDRAQIGGNEALPMVQLQTKLNNLLRDESAP